MSARSSNTLPIRAAIALAFADASIVVLALPQIVSRLHTSISHVVWVIVAYNLALIVTSLALLPLARRTAPSRLLLAGLGLFGAASIGCGAAGALSALIPLRCLQGIGGAMVCSASLPLLAGARTRPRAGGELRDWAAAAAIGAAVGPAAGGVLTQLFDWRSIFFAQAPVAALAAAAVVAMASRGRLAGDEPAAPPRARPLSTPGEDGGRSAATIHPAIANLALALLSAGLIGALFLVVIELINAWLVSPIGAAAIVTAIPLATLLAERVSRLRATIVTAAAGAVLVAAGLGLLGVLSHRQLAPVVIALALCGAGLGLAFPSLTMAALSARGPSATARAARTIAARDGGLVLGLLVLTPVFVNQLAAAPTQATFTAAGQVIAAPLPLSTKLRLAPGLEAAANSAPESQLPDIAPVFAAAAAGAPPDERLQLAALQRRLDQIINRAVTTAFKRPFLLGALFALAVLPVLGLAFVPAARRPPNRPARG